MSEKAIAVATLVVIFWSCPGLLDATMVVVGVAAFVKIGEGIMIETLEATITRLQYELLEARAHFE